MSLTTVAGTIVQSTLQLSATQNQTGSAANTNATTASKKYAYVLGGNIALGINEIYNSLQTITASSSFSLDLTTFTDLLANASITLARVKAIQIWTLGTADTAPDGTAGTSSTSITIDNTVTNALSAQTHSGWFDNAAEGAANGSKFTLPNGGLVLFALGNAAGVVVDSTHKVIKITNNDSSNSATVLITVLGSTT